MDPQSSNIKKRFKVKSLSQMTAMPVQVSRPNIKSTGATNSSNEQDMLFLSQIHDANSLYSYMIHFCRDGKLRNLMSLVNYFVYNYTERLQTMSPMLRPPIKHQARFFLTPADLSRLINRLDKENFSPLHYAVRFQHFQVVQYLIMNCFCDVNLPGPSSATPLHIAARYRSEKVNKEVMSTTGSSPPFINDTTLKVNSIISFLIYHGANVNATDSHGATPLHYAVIRNNLLSITELLESSQTINIEIKDKLWLTCLHHAAERGNLSVGQLLISHGANILCLDRSGMTPLHIAAEEGHTEFAKLLIDTYLKSKNNDAILLGKNLINHTNRHYETPLHFAAAGGHLDFVKLLLSNSANPEMVDVVNCNTPAHLACSAGSLEIVVQLLAVNSNLVNMKNKAGDTILHIAASLNKKKIINFILTSTFFSFENDVEQKNIHFINGKNIDINVCDNDRQTAMMHAIKRDNSSVIACFIKFFEKIPFETCVDMFLTHRDIDDYNIFHFCAAFDSNECFKLLYEFIFSRFEKDLKSFNEADVNLLGKSISEITDSPFIDDPFISTTKNIVPNVNVNNNVNVPTTNNTTQRQIKQSKHEFVTLLKRFFLSFDMHENTPLHLSAEHGNIAMCKTLMNVNITALDAKNDHGYTPLLLASKAGSTAIVEYILSYSAALVLDRDDMDNSALHLACLHGHIDVIDKLLLFGAPVNVKNADQHTPLDCAIYGGHIKAIQKLLETDDANLENNDRTRPSSLFLACFLGRHEIVELLLNYGADIYKLDNRGRNCLDIAIDENHKEVCIKLIQSDYWIILLRHTSKTNTISEHSFFSGESLTRTTAGNNVVNQPNNQTITEKFFFAGGGDQNTTVKTVKRYVFRKKKDQSFDLDHEKQPLQSKNHNLLKPSEKTARIIEKYTTPMRKLIKKMPDVAKMAFDRCIIDNGLPNLHPKYQLILNYEFLDDLATDWGGNLEGNFTTEDDHHKMNKSSVSVDTVDFDKFKEWFSFRKRGHDKHPLSIMVNKERVDLLKHPLVTNLLRYKWQKFGSAFYYVRFTFYILFLFLLTGYSLTVYSEPQLSLKYTHSTGTLTNSTNLTTNHCSVPVAETEGLGLFFVLLGTIFILVFAILNVAFKITLAVIKASKLELNDYVEFIAYILVIFYMIGTVYVYNRHNLNTVEIKNTARYILENEHIKNYRCSNGYRTVGSLSLWLCWFTFVLFLRKLPKIGIYVVMYTDIFRTFLQFAPIYFLIVLSFAFPFYMVFHDRPEPQSYITPFRSIVKTFLGTVVGEVEYDTFYNDAQYPPINVAWVLLIASMLSSSLILMNLLIGLAIDDIQGVQSKAVLKRLALQVELAMEIESSYPVRLRRKYIKLTEKIHPNETRTWNFWSLWETKSTGSTQSNESAITNKKIEHMEKTQQELQSLLKQVNRRLKRIEQSCQEVVYNSLYRRGALDDVTVQEVEENDNSDV